MFNKAKDIAGAIIAVVIIGGVTVAIPLMGIVLGIIFSLWITYTLLQDHRKQRLKNQQSDQRN